MSLTLGWQTDTLYSCCDFSFAQVVSWLCFCYRCFCWKLQMLAWTNALARTEGTIFQVFLNQSGSFKRNYCLLERDCKLNLIRGNQGQKKPSFKAPDSGSPPGPEESLCNPLILFPAFKPVAKKFSCSNLHEVIQARNLGERWLSCLRMNFILLKAHKKRQHIR